MIQNIMEKQYFWEISLRYIYISYNSINQATATNHKSPQKNYNAYSITTIVIFASGRENSTNDNHYKAIDIYVKYR